MCAYNIMCLYLFYRSAADCPSLRLSGTVLFVVYFLVAYVTATGGRAEQEINICEGADYSAFCSG